MNDQYFPEDLPKEASEIIQNTDNAIKTINDEANSKIAEIKEQKALEIKDVREHAEQRIRLESQHLADKLKPIMESYAKDGKLNEALAIRAKLKQCKQLSTAVRPDPGTLADYEDEINRTFYFDVMGDMHGIVWGTEIYTADSLLATAVVHAGLLRDGERGIVKAEIVDMTGMVTVGSYRNDVTSSDWGPYPFGFKLSKP